MIPWDLIELLAVMLSLVFLGTFFHELGHYVDAKREGNYKGWAVLPTPHIKLTRKYKSRWTYLHGFFWSLVVLPLWMMIFGWDSFWMFLVIQAGGAVLDFVVFLFHGRIQTK